MNGADNITALVLVSCSVNWLHNKNGDIKARQGKKHSKGEPLRALLTLYRHDDRHLLCNELTEQDTRCKDGIISDALKHEFNRAVGWLYCRQFFIS
jgi:hypothetical protein